jgi:hypothetical protein
MKRYPLIALFALLSLLFSSGPTVEPSVLETIISLPNLPAAGYANYVVAVHKAGFAASSFIEHVIDDSFGRAWSVYATDIDGDGDMDVLGAAIIADDIAWWENDGSEHFSKHIIAGSFDGARSVYATDVDGDGDVDVLGAAGAAGEIAWWENDGSEHFTKHTITSGFSGATSVYTVDVDGDRDVDILGAAEEDNEITWWENDGNEHFTEHTIMSTFYGAQSVYATDIDGDGDVDVLGAAKDYSDEIIWLENDGSEHFTKHVITSSFDYAVSVYATDVDSDGDMDALGAAERAHAIKWWKNDGSEHFTEHTIADSFNGASSVYATDVDGDGDVDILGAAYLANDITWWENDGTEYFTEHTITDDFRGAMAVYATDIDSDGDVDVLGAAWLDSSITWWENTSGAPDTGTIQGRILDASTTSGIGGVLIQAGTFSTTTGIDGYYSLAVDPGKYDQITARKTGYYASNSSADVMPGDLVSVNFELTSHVGTGFGVWIGKPPLASASDEQVGDILEDIAANGGGIVYFPAYDPITSTTETIRGTFLFTETVPWNGTVTNTDISFNPSYTYSLPSFVATAHDTFNLRVYASIPCFVAGNEQYVIPNAPADRDRMWPHLKEVAQYLLDYDVDGIVLDYVRYPSRTDIDPLTATIRISNITGFVKDMVEEISEAEIVVTTWAPTDENQDVRGQDLSQLAELHPAAVSPQLYAGSTYPNYEGDNDLETLRGYHRRARREIGKNAQYIPVFQAYDSEEKDHICKPGGERLLAAIAAASPSDNSAVFAYEHLSSFSDSCAEKEEWFQLAAFIPQPWYAKIIDAVTGIIASGIQESFQFVNETTSELTLTFRWSGGESTGAINQAGDITLSSDVLEVQVYRPGGTLYGTFDLIDSIEVITIPGAEPGTWECKVTTTSAVSQRYTAVVGAVTYQVHLPIVLRNR